MKVRDCIVIMLLVAATAATGWMLFKAFSGDKAPEGKADGKTLVARRLIADNAKKEKKRFRHVKVKVDKALKPELQLDEEDEAKLSTFCKRVLREVQEALDKEDLKTLVIVLEKIKVKIVEAERNGQDVDSIVPEIVRVRAIEACGWFGASALPEILDGMTDSSAQVREMSVEQFQAAIDDASFGDYDRAELVKAASKVITDTEALDSIFMAINDMRNSVIADTVSSILATGTDEAKALMREQIEFFTESDVKTAEDVKDWLSENPDDPDDDEMYGPMDSHEEGLVEDEAKMKG